MKNSATSTKYFTEWIVTPIDSYHISWIRQNRHQRNSNEINESIIKHSLLLPYQGEKGSTSMKTLSKELRRILPENIIMGVIYTGTKLESQFNIKGPIPKRHNHDIIYHTVCLEYNCNEDYIGKWARRLEERTKDHNGRDKNTFVTSLNRKWTWWSFRIRFLHNWKRVSSPHLKKKNFWSIIYQEQKATIK